MKVVTEQKADELVDAYTKKITNKFIDKSLVFFLKEEADRTLAISCAASLFLTLTNQAFNKEQAIAIKKFIVEGLDEIIEKNEG